MKLELQKDQLDLGVTPIENMFINTLMANANESQIKVYLYALSLAHMGVDNASNENIAAEMNLSEGQVVDAWSYWIDKGVVEKNGDSYIFKSMRLQILAPQLADIQISTENPAATSENVSSDIPTEEENLAVRDMIKSIEAFIAQSSDVQIILNPREIRKIVELMNDFNASPDFMSYAYMIASGIRGTKSVDPLVATMRNWMIDGATDMEKLDTYIEARNKSKEEAKASKTKNTTKNKQRKQQLIDNDDRLTKEERRAFVEAKLQKKIPINKKNRK